MIDTMEGLRVSPVLLYEFTRQLSGAAPSSGGLSWLGRDPVSAPAGGGEPIRLGERGPLPLAGRLVSMVSDMSRLAPRVEIWDVLWVSDAFTALAGTTYPFTSSIPVRGLGGLGARIVLVCGSPSTDSMSWDLANTVTYTNSAGVAGRTASIPTNSLSSTDVFHSLILQSGDLGVRSIESATFAADVSATGVARLSIVRPLCGLGTVVGNPDVYQPRHAKLPMLTPRLAAGAMLTAAVWDHTGSTAQASSFVFSVALDA